MTCDCNPLLIKLGRHEDGCLINHIIRQVKYYTSCECKCRHTIRITLRDADMTVDDACIIMNMDEYEKTIIKGNIINEDVMNIWLKFCRPITELPLHYSKDIDIQELLNCKCCSEHQHRRMWFF
jgi:hypothetical protein